MARPLRDASLASFDWLAFGNAVRAAALGDGRLDRAIAASIGVTPTAFSRARSRGNVDAGAVIALCRWMRHRAEDFYIEPVISDTCTSFRVKQGACETCVEHS